MKALYINIGSDTESRDLTEKELERVGLKAERVSAVTGDNRPLAFNKSVYKAMEMAIVSREELHTQCGIIRTVKTEDLLLFEDDVVFDTNAGNDLDDFIHRVLEERLPDGWMTLHLGCNIIGMDTTVWQMPTHHSEYMAKLWNCYQSHATLYSAECVKFILDNMNPNVLNEDSNIFDDWLRRKVLSQGRSYVMKPMICFQRPRVSEIWGGFQDYTSAHRRGNEYLNRL